MNTSKIYRLLFVVTLLLATVLGFWGLAGNAGRNRIAMADPLSKLRVTASYVIYTNGTTVYALNGETGKVEFEGTDAATVIQSTIAPKRKVFVTAGKYVITSPLDVATDFELEMETGAILEVPNGYDGAVFRLGTGSDPEDWFGVRNARITGGTLREEGRILPYEPPPPNPLPPPQRKWTAFLLHVTDVDGGIRWSTIEEVEIWDPDVAVKLQIDATGGWIMGNEFKGLQINLPNKFIVYGTSLSDDPEPADLLLNNNLFFAIEGQAGYNTSYGVQDVRGRGNTFLDCKFWDLHNPDAVSVSLTPYAIDTLILGGLMTYKNVDDQGHRTHIIDRFPGNALTLDELVVGRASQSTAYYWHADEEGLHVREHHATGEAMRIDPDGTLMTDQISELTPGAGITLGGDLRLQEDYRIFGQDGELFLVDENTGQMYRFVLAPVPVGE